MFTKKMLLIIASILILVAVISIVFLNMKKKAITPIDNNSPSADSGSTSNGGVGITTPGNTTDSRGFSVKSDPAQPFALTKPRGNEPVIAQNTSTKFKDYNKAVADGIIPDQNGMYHQKVDPNYDPSADPNTNYNLASSAFVNTYYPNASQYIAGKTPEQQQQFNSDPIVSVDSQASGANVNTNIPTIPEADPKIFRVTQDNSVGAVKTYISNLSKALSDLDLVSDPNGIQTIFSTKDPANIDNVKTRLAAVQSLIKTVPVPVKMLGMSEAYYLAYTRASAFLDDTKAANNLNDGSGPGVILQTQKDGTALTDYLDLINKDISATTLILSGK
jgi:hypothetical protein